MERYRLSALMKDIERGGDIDVVIAADAQRALDAEREKVAKLEKIQAIDLKNNNEYREQLATLQAQLARWKEVLGEWLWNCTNLLGDYHIKTVHDFNEEVNRRIAWLMQHLDYTLPPPMTDEERDRMRKLSEDNVALQADNECKDSLIETLQAQLRQVREANGKKWLVVFADQDRGFQTFDTEAEAVHAYQIAVVGYNCTLYKPVKPAATLAAQDAGQGGLQ